MIQPLKSPHASMTQTQNVTNNSLALMREHTVRDISTKQNNGHEHRITIHSAGITRTNGFTWILDTPERHQSLVTKQPQHQASAQTVFDSKKRAALFFMSFGLHRSRQRLFLCSLALTISRREYRTLPRCFIGPSQALRQFFAFSR